MKKKFNKKIHFSKMTVSNLNVEALQVIRGGNPSHSCPDVTCNTLEANCTETCISVNPIYCF